MQFFALKNLYKMMGIKIVCLMEIKIKSLCVVYVVPIKAASVLSRTLNVEMSRQTLSSSI